MIKKLSQIWNYFKKGRNEIGLILGLYSLMLSYSIKFDVNFTIPQYGLVTLIFGFTCAILGVFLAENVEPENNRISPWVQDSLKSTIHLQNSLIAHYRGNNGVAVKEMDKAQALREKWLR